ncbi:MAG: protein kinase domain-containing protein [Chitinispirillaceae bacterium]
MSSEKTDITFGEPHTQISHDTSEKTDPFIGKKIGNCELIEKINEGGTAYIYRGYNSRFELDRVVKILKPALAEDEEFYYRFTQEAQLTARLDHPNILRVYDTGEVEGYFYIEMEHIAGQTLRSYIQSNPRISERDVLRFAIQIAKALEYAHHVAIESPHKGQIKGILHRDIKPENIMILPDKSVKLMDFGAAKPLNITSSTMQGMIVGTFHYMSPEQLMGEELDVRSDFFSLGIVLYEVLTGQKPFTANNLTQLIEKIKECKFPAPTKIRPSISPMTEELVLQLLSKKKDHRPRSSKEIEESLQVCIQSYNAWGNGQKVRVPFSFKRFYPTFALIISCAALGISVFNLLQASLSFKPPAFAQEVSVSLLEKARDLEKEKQWKEAVTIYELVPSVKDGGLANEYLEAQIRRAFLLFKRLDQYTKARSILEKLRMDYSDPAIDAYLGQIYFKLALYIEARDRLDAALSSNKGSVIPQSLEVRSKLLFDYANSLDRQYTYVDKNAGLLMEARKAWDYYIEFSECHKKVNDEDCRYAKERKKELEEDEKEQKE